MVILRYTHLTLRFTILKLVKQMSVLGSFVGTSSLPVKVHPEKNHNQKKLNSK
jgi:hypothetical protein